jgi:hypothetical protein
MFNPDVINPKLLSWFNDHKDHGIFFSPDRKRLKVRWICVDCEKVVACLTHEVIQNYNNTDRIIKLALELGSNEPTKYEPTQSEQLLYDAMAWLGNYCKKEN